MEKTSQSQSLNPRRLRWLDLLLGIAFSSFGLLELSERLLSTGAERSGRAEALLAWAGRHSLAIYLLHQPLLFGGVWLAYRMTL